MIMIEEMSINLCNTKLDMTELYLTLNYYNHKLEEVYDKKPDRVYVGYEYCDKMVNFFSKTDLTAIVKAVENFNMRVTYVMPPVREEYFDKHAEILNELLNNTNLDEIVVNDFGMLNYLHTKFSDVKADIVLGRLFDKAVRETRFSILELDSIKKNLGEISKSNLFDKTYLSLFKNLNINRIELDTFPDGIQDIPEDCLFNVSIYYPKVYVSRSSYCEAGSIEQKPENKFKLSNICCFECSKIYKKIILEDNSRELIKQGNAILFNQPKLLKDIVNGKFRLVFSPVFLMESVT